MLEKPGWIVDRDREWSFIVRLLHPSWGHRGMHIAAISGRRRTGKTFLLEELERSAQALYYAADRQHTQSLAQSRFADEIVRYEPEAEAEVRAIPLEWHSTWERLLECAFKVTYRRRTDDVVPPVIIDEFPYLLEHSPELPSVVQRLYDTHMRLVRPHPPGADTGAVEGRLVLAGSAMSVMHELGHGSRPLFGRLAWNMTLPPFSHTDAARFWGIEDPQVAVRLHAILGGSPGYHSVLAPRFAGSVRTREDLDRFVTDTLLAPFPYSPFTEDEVGYLLREDPRIGDKRPYLRAMQAVAAGATTVGKVASKMELSHHEADVLVSLLVAMRYVEERIGLMRQKLRSIRLADPVFRFHEAVVGPYSVPLKDGDITPQEVWRQSGQRFRSQILGPAFEEIAHRAGARLLRRDGLEVGHTGFEFVHDQEGRTTHELDLVATPMGEVPQLKGNRILAIGEAKASERPRETKDLSRLRQIREIMGRENDAGDARLVIFSMSGFSDDLRAEADKNDDVLLYDLDDIYSIS